MTKRGSDDLKKLSALQATLVRIRSRTLYVDPRFDNIAQPSKKTQMQKTAHDFQLSFVAFQRAQQLSAEKQRTVVQSVKLAVEEDSET
jgi:hypothetical protein